MALTPHSLTPHSWKSWNAKIYNAPVNSIHSGTGRRAGKQEKSLCVIELVVKSHHLCSQQDRKQDFAVLSPTTLTNPEPYHVGNVQRETNYYLQVEEFRGHITVHTHFCIDVNQLYAEDG